MENKGNNSGRRGEARVVPKRGQIKAKIFAEVAKKFKAAVSVVRKKEEGSTTSSSATTTPPRSAYTSEGHSDS